MLAKNGFVIVIEGEEQHVPPIRNQQRGEQRDDPLQDDVDNWVSHPAFLIPAHFSPPSSLL